MKVLFVCSMGMSSQIAVDALKKEAEKHGVTVDVTAVGSNEFEEKVKEGFDIAMVAPQIRHRYDYLKEQAEDAGVPCTLIEPMAYSPLGGPKLYKQAMNLFEENK